MAIRYHSCPSTPACMSSCTRCCRTFATTVRRACPVRPANSGWIGMRPGCVYFTTARTFGRRHKLMSSACDGTSPRGLKSRRFLLSVEPAATALGSRAAYVVVALAIGKLLQFQIQLGNTHGFDRPSLAWSALFLALTAPAGIVIHECGHCLAGAALRQHCRRFVIGPVEWARGARGWTVRGIPIRRAGMVDLVPSTFAQFSAAPGDLHCRGPYGLAPCGFGFPGPVVGSPH